MKKKGKTPASEAAMLAAEIKGRMELWEELKEKGGSDPSWSDGVNMNLVRNHIISAKRQVKEICEGNGMPLPEEYSIPTPPETDRNYMARADEIRHAAGELLERCRADENYRNLVDVLPRLGAAEQQSLGAAARSVAWLGQCIENDDLVALRRIVCGDIPGRLARSAAKAKDWLDAEIVQMTVFDMGYENGRKG